MTRIEAETLLHLFRTPGWSTYLKLKGETLDKLHAQLEWEEANIKKIQGRIEEIRLDLSLQKKVETVLDKL
jgi:hypothetical protein